MQENIQGSRHAIKFIAQFVSALLKTRTFNLVKVANAFETEAESDSVYCQMQRFLKNEISIVKSFMQLPKTKEIPSVGEIYSSTVVCLAKR